MQSNWAASTWAATSIWLALAGLGGGPAQATASPIARALGEMSQRLEESPRDAELLNDYGNLLVHAGFLKDAETAYRAALEVTPDSLAAHYNLGLLEFETGRVRAARTHFRSAIKIDPSFGRAHYGLASTFVARDRNRRAVKHYSTALRLDPELGDVRRNPEILFNKLATWASMHSYLRASPGRSRRIYADPRPIVGLLIPGLEEILDGANEPPAAEEAPLEEPPVEEPPVPDVEAEPAAEAQG